MFCHKELRIKNLWSLVLLALFFLLYSLFSPLTASADWTFDASAPTCGSISFNKDSGQLTGTAITVRVTASDNNAVSGITITPSPATNTFAKGTSSCSGPGGSCSSMDQTYTWTPDTAGSFTFTASAADTNGNTNSSCAASSPFTVTAPARPETAGVPVFDSLSCSNDRILNSEEAIKFSWTNPAQPVFQVNIDGPRTCAYKNVAAGTLSTTAPLGFWNDCIGRSGVGLYLDPDRPYGVTLRNSVGFGPTASFSIPTCVPPVEPTITYNTTTLNNGTRCATGPYSDSEIKVSGQNTGDPVSLVQLSRDPSFNDLIANVWGKFVTTTANQPYEVFIPTGTWVSVFGGVSSSLALQPGITYYARVYNGKYSLGTSFSLPLCPSCDGGATCTGTCTAPSNTCSTGNGTQGNCQYQSSTGGSCIPAPAPPQPCGTLNNCTAPNTCLGGTCLPPCTTNISCTGSCNAPANTCSTNNGTWGSCTYVGDGSCIPAPAPLQPCTADACVLPDICTNPGPSATCQTPPPPPPSQAGFFAICPSPGTEANVYWDRVTGSTYYLARVGSRTADTRISNPSDPTIPNTTVPTTTNTTYNSWGVRACNTGGCSTEALGSPPIECKSYPPFLKTTGGDVHSNQ